MKSLTKSSNIYNFDINGRTSNGLTPLHFSAKHGHFDIVLYLVEVCGADVEVPNEYGLTPLHFACIGYCYYCCNNNNNYYYYYYSQNL